MTVLRTSLGGKGRNFAFISVSLLALAACEEGGEFTLFQPNPAGQSQGTSASTSTRLVERDIEAPDVFSVTDQGLWDGRPSLGGVWVAHPEVQDPERVIIRNTANGKFVIGALFRRERENPGPTVQVSSDAAAALGLLAGAPEQLNITALRREAAEEDVAADELPAAELDAPDAVEATTLDPVASASAAIDAADTAVTPVAATPEPAPQPRATSSLEKPFLQIGIFSVEQNANNTATAMRQAGMVPTVKKHSASGKAFWRVIVGPATTKSERSALLKKIKEIGFTDAYPVTN